jgi:hypothetical protein
VHVMSYHRGSIVAEIRLSSVVPSSGGVQLGLRTGKMLGNELLQIVQDASGMWICMCICAYV